MSTMLFEYEGKEYPLSFVRGYLSHSDRAVRKAAAESIGNGLAKHGAELDRIYDELVKVRTEIARKMGYKTYTELGYYRMGRMDYNRDMVEKFRDNVKDSIVGVVAELKNQIKDEIGLDAIMFYDNDTYSNGPAPDPVLDANGIFEKAKEMYDDMSPITSDFMRRMLEAEAFDTEARDGKWGGGYCTEFNDYKQPFILANFNGTSADIDVITHEFGHALASDFCFKCGDRELGIGGMETAECHSMSMEFFAWKYADKFFGNLTGAYKKKHLLAALTFIPYGVAVDEFQHVVYDNPDMTPAQRNELWASLEKKYRPYMSYEGVPYLDKGTRWQYQMHIFESPFYYIDYCLAQTVAFGFLVKSREDYDKAFSDYIDFVKQGGQKAFETLVKEAGIASPFTEGALDSIASNVLKISRELSDLG
jgi:M3 family oligoendopeptidase